MYLQFGAKRHWVLKSAGEAQSSGAFPELVPSPAAQSSSGGGADSVMGAHAFWCTIPLDISLNSRALTQSRGVTVLRVVYYCVFNADYFTSR